MSNRASITRTMFTSDDGSSTWGWRICDDYFRSYDDSCEEHEVPGDPLQLLATACAEATEDERILFAHLLTNNTGLNINGSWHEFEKIAPILRAALEKEN